MCNSLKEVGIVGFGPMGQLMAEHMFPESEISFVDTGVSDTPDANSAFKRENNARDFAFSSDAIVISVPASAYWSVLNEVVVKPEICETWPDDIKKDFVSPLIIDPCSVKLFTHALQERMEPNYPELLHCHPLFGPQSAKDGIKGQTVIVTKKKGEKAEEILSSWENLGLNVIEMSAEEHDRKMAKIQGIPFILGRLANELEINMNIEAELTTTSFSAARELAVLDKAHSEELFRTVVEFNPFVAQLNLPLMEQKLYQIKSRTMLGQLLLGELGLLAKT